MTQSVVKYDEVDADDKSVKKVVKKSSKSPKNLKGLKVAKVIGLEKRLPKHQFSVEELELLLEL